MFARSFEASPTFETKHLSNLNFAFTWAATHVSRRAGARASDSVSQVSIGSAQADLGENVFVVG